MRPASFTTGVESTVEGGPRLDEAALLAWLRREQPQLLPPAAASLAARPFSHGQSNPTYLVQVLPEAGRGGAPPSPLATFVLRKQPGGSLLAKAHDVLREHALLVALAPTPVPVAAPLARCADASVLGTPFFLMSHVAGRVFVDPSLPELRPGERAAVYAALGATLRALQAVDPAAAGLAALAGRGGGRGYAARQVARWAEQYAAAAARSPPPPGEAADMAAASAWLRAAAPAPSPRVGLVHGDFRLDNLIFDAADPSRVLAVLDWELASLGDDGGRADVGFACLPYHLPPSGPFPRLPARPPLPAGVPTEAQLRAACGHGGGCGGCGDGDSFWVGLALFRLASILAGVRARAAAGHAAAPDGAAAGAGAAALAAAAASLARLAAAAAAAAAAPHPAAQPSHFSAPAAPPSPPFSALVPPRSAPLLARLEAFLAARVAPAEAALWAHARSPDRWSVHPVVEELKAAAKAARLWNLWLPADSAAMLRCGAGAGAARPAGGGGGGGCGGDEPLLLGLGLSNAEYAPLAEAMGAYFFAPEVFNCSAPDTGNMELLLRHGSAEQQAAWLLPLLRGDTRSCFAMTEPGVGSSDATNISARVARLPAAPGQPPGSPARLRLDGAKWWASGACDPRCSLCIYMGVGLAPAGAPAPAGAAAAAPPPPPSRHAAASMVLVPMPAPGLAVLRPLTVFGYDDAPHGHAELLFSGVELPCERSALLGPAGSGFALAQARLGPGRLHHCLRLLGAGQRALALAAGRAKGRNVFGQPLAEQGAFRARLAAARLALEQARLVTHAAAAALDRGGARGAAGALAMAKLAAPAAAAACLDFAIQAHGAAGVSADTPLAYLWAGARALRIADGPDEVHLHTLAKLELAGRARL